MSRRDMEDVINELAGKHHVGLSKDDPILIFHSLQQIMLEDLESQVHSCIELFQAAVMELTLDLSKGIDQDAKDKLNIVVNAHKRAMDGCLSDFTKRTISELTAALDPCMSGLREEVRSAGNKGRVTAYLNLTASIMTFFAVGVGVYAVCMLVTG